VRKTVFIARLKEARATHDWTQRRLKEARATHDWTQSYVAELAGISAAHVSHFERGRRLPSVQNLCALALVLGVSTDWLCGHGGTLIIKQCPTCGGKGVIVTKE